MVMTIRNTGRMFDPRMNYNFFSSASPAVDCTHGGAAIIVHKSL